MVAVFASWKSETITVYCFVDCLVLKNDENVKNKEMLNLLSVAILFSLRGTSLLNIWILADSVKILLMSLMNEGLTCIFIVSIFLFPVNTTNSSTFMPQHPFVSCNCRLVVDIKV